MASSEEGKITYTVTYHPQFETDLKELDREELLRLEKLISQRLRTAPHKYGKPLMSPLSGFWKLRMGDYRLIFKITSYSIWVLGVVHRRKVYSRINKRLLWQPRRD